MTDFFKPEDFKRGDVLGFDGRNVASIIANEKLEKALGQEVYQTIGQLNNNYWSCEQSREDKRKARLFVVQEIKKEPCTHKNVRSSDGINAEYFCYHCEKYLKPTGWEPV